MELLTRLLREKVAREGLTPADVAALSQAPAAAAAKGGSAAPAAAANTASASSAATTANSSAPAAAAGSRHCWLCGKESRMRFRLKNSSALCFDCFRVAYMSLVLPRINTAARRRSDVAFIEKINSLGGGSGGDGGEALEASLAELVELPQASFARSSSRLRNRNASSDQSHGGDGGGGGAGSPRAGDLNSMWACPRCTYANDYGLRACDACGFVNPGVVKCKICGVDCPLGGTLTSSAAAVAGAGGGAARTRSLCKDGKPHIVWGCRDCGRVNTVDGDVCMGCGKPRYWACSQCTALHATERTGEGLRYCSTCGSYNTPDDIETGQEKIDREHKKATLVQAQQQQDSGEFGGDRNSSSGGSGGVVFGVNDAGTVAEMERQQRIRDNEKRLNARLKRLGVQSHQQKTDGNCLFAALAHQLFGNSKLHPLVRSLVVSYMHRNKADYAMLFDGEREWAAYVTEMGEAGKWGDELCLNAAARCFSVNIHVITSDERRWHMVFQQEDLGRSQSRLRGGRNNNNNMAASSASGSSASNTASMSISNANANGSGSPLAQSLRQQQQQSTVCLFLAYFAPVHYEDITPSPVSSIVLSDLLIPQLQSMLSEESSVPAPPANLSVRAAASERNGNASGSAARNSHSSGATTTTTTAAAASTQRRTSGGAASASGTVLPPVVPPSRAHADGAAAGGK